MIKEIEIGDLVRMARNPDAYGKRSLLVGLVIDFCEDHKHFLDTPGVCAKDRSILMNSILLKVRLYLASMLLPR